MIDHYRTRKEFVSLDDAVSLPAKDQDVDDQIQSRFELQAMRDALQFLTEEQQQVLVLKFISGLDTREIAKYMNKSEGAIRALQMRALQALAKVIEDGKSYG